MSLEADISAALNLHNKARRDANGAHRQNLTWDPSLALAAEAYALQMAIRGESEHSTERHRQGENLYWSSNFSTLEEATQAWLSEKPLYNGEALPDAGDEEGMRLFMEKGYGHYTQLIWPETTRVGMGFFFAPDDGEWTRPGTFVVARYDQSQVGGQTAWRASESNPFGERGVTDHGGSVWEEEEWIRKYGPGHHLYG